MKTLIDEKYLPEAALKDSFNRYYIYRQAENGKNYKLCSMGKDRKFRTEDDIEAPVIGHSFDDLENNKQKLRKIQSALETYFSDNNKYPERLDILVEKKYLEESVLKDSWQNYFKYEQVENDKKYKLYSSGKDGWSGTSDDIRAETEGVSAR